MVFLCGGSAAGKTTVAEYLKHNHGFAHFDGDLFCVGVGPCSESGRRPTPDDLQRCPAEITRLRENFFTEYLDKVIAGEPGDLSACDELYGAMAASLCKLRAEGLSEQCVVISHIVCYRPVRDVLRRVFGPELECLILLTPREVLVERRMARMEAVAAARCKTAEELAMSYPGQGTAEQKIQTSLKRCIAAEPRADGEERCYQMEVTRDMDELAVAELAQACLGLTATL